MIPPPAEVLEIAAAVNTSAQDAGVADRVPAFVSELICDRVDVILACGGTAPVLAAEAATMTMREQAEAGGLMSYGARVPVDDQQMGVHVGRILTGERPADLRLQPPAKFDLVINLKTARATGISIPPNFAVIE